MRRIGAHRRVSEQDEDGRGPTARGLAAGSALVCLHGHARERRRRPRRRRSYGLAHCLRRDRSAPGRTAGGDRVPAGAAGLLSPARDCDRGAGRLDLRHQRRARTLAPPVGTVRARDRGGFDAAASAGDRHRQPRDGRPPAGQEARDRQAPGRDRGSRQRPGPVHRQDRHPDRGSDLVHAGARRRGQAGRPHRHARPGLRRQGRQRARPRALGRPADHPRRERPDAARPPALRPRPAAGLGPRRHCAGTAADLQGRARSRPRPLHDRACRVEGDPRRALRLRHARRCRRQPSAHRRPPRQRRRARPLARGLPLLHRPGQAGRPRLARAPRPSRRSPSRS